MRMARWQRAVDPGGCFGAANFAGKAITKKWLRGEPQP
jgi:hypothetical protein